MARRIAISGTPGTGKSVVAGLLLAGGVATEEVGPLAARLGCAKRRSPGFTVDLDALVRRTRRPSAFRSEVVVGHLSHLLPIRDVVVLRCHPFELDRRLGKSRRGSLSDRRENLVSEAIGLVTYEGLQRRRNLYEIDTTGRSPPVVAREILRWMRGPRAPRWGRVDWLADPRVTEHLLEWAR